MFNFIMRKANNRYDLKKGSKNLFWEGPNNKNSRFDVLDSKLKGMGNSVTEL